MINLITFEEKNINMIIGEDGEPLFELYGVGQALGYEKIDIKDGKEYRRIRKDRINKVVANADIEPFAHAGRKFLTEEMIYDFMFEARTDKCKAFRKWLSHEVLPSIRQNGAYISENITDSQQDLLAKYGMPRFRKNTFLNTPVEKIEEIYKECMEYHKKKSAPERIKIEKEIVSVLENRENQALTNGSAPLALMIKTEIAKIQKNITTRSNRSYGVKLARANKELGQVYEQLEEYYEYIDKIVPSAEEYHCLYLHGFSVNSQYIPDVDRCGIIKTDRSGNLKLKRTASYNQWLNKFKTEMNKLGNLDVNFDNEVDVYLYFDHMERFDCHNFQKSIFDALSKHFNVDDSCFHLKLCDTNEYVDSYEDGKIYFCIRERESLKVA